MGVGGVELGGGLWRRGTAQSQAMIFIIATLLSAPLFDPPRPRAQVPPVDTVSEWTVTSSENTQPS